MSCFFAYVLTFIAATFSAQLDGLKQSHMALATLEDATNLGLEMEEARTVVLILSPSYEVCILNGSH